MVGVLRAFAENGTVCVIGHQSVLNECRDITIMDIGWSYVAIKPGGAKGACRISEYTVENLPLMVYH